RGSRHLDISVHAAAGVEQQPDMELRAGLQVFSTRELLERLRLAVLEDLEILTQEVSEVLPATICHRRRDADELGPGAKGSLLGVEMGDRKGQDWSQKSDGGPGHKDMIAARPGLLRRRW